MTFFLWNKIDVDIQFMATGLGRVFRYQVIKMHKNRLITYPIGTIQRHECQFLLRQFFVGAAVEHNSTGT
jgi:hypothetical protein